ncbi:MAG: hypothetical protein M1546_19025 [Chloroflexi bacterium]|nr:hypothetical protein [Chloroflexota bacterium]
MFLVPLLLGFAFNSASAFTAAYSRRWGERRGQRISLLLRDIAGIPLWVVGLGLAMRTPSPMLVPSSVVTDALGWLLTATGSIMILLALAALGRRAAAPALRDSLVAHGVYACVRHPIYDGMLLIFPGLFLLSPSVAMLVACALGVAWAVLQARLEEIDLLQRMPAYYAYMARVPRFIPRLSRR